MADSGRSTPTLVADDDDREMSNGPADDQHETIDLTDDDDDEREVVRELTPGELREYQRPNRPAGHSISGSAKVPCGTISTNERVELVNGGFLLVKEIMQAPTGEKYLNGILMKRTWQVMDKIGADGQLHAVLPLQKNELCMMIKTGDDRPGSPLDEHSLVRVSLDDVHSVRQITITNHSFPAHSFREPGLSVNPGNYREIEKTANLVCRWKFVEVIDLAARKATAFELAPLREAECDPGYRRPDKQRFTNSRSTTPTPKSRDHTGRRHPGAPHGQSATDDGDEKTYISADLFAGAGGATSGVIMAGFDVRYVLDLDADACKTVQRNYNGKIRNALHMDIKDFIAALQGAQSEEYTVDFLHVSYPCQAHSWLNRGQNREKDLEGISLCYSLREILLIVRPRVVTLEQTNGILTKEGGQHFRALIYDLTKTEYAPRKRLIIIGACPGERLPPFPKPTHGTGPGLLSLVTIHDCISQITPESLVDNMGLGSRPRDHPPYDPHTQLQGCITRSGGEGNKHPDGSHSFNCRELACLMTYPLYYQFAGGITAIKLQIGNSVPPVVMKAISAETVRSLRQSDAEMAAYRPEEVVIEDDKEGEEATGVRSAKSGCAESPILLDESYDGSGWA
ncbi:hypothetical protein B0A55_06434 [Friedmanniomyces simplex]|uniref:DNA (cytosine-5-)-methyltransferase n=1 Tax=Friedmanniomyces simplex TaxID=329884 RepID=A0A4U0XFY9_9PEZI|nr:hypothetical protein B0A55_06434 [Friedmanniomyces simplex]